MKRKPAPEPQQGTPSQQKADPPATGSPAPAKVATADPVAPGKAAPARTPSRATPPRKGPLGRSRWQR